MALYEIKNVSKNGHVFVEVRGVQTLKPGGKKVVELSDADRYHPNIVSLEGDHIEVTPYKPEAKEPPAKKPEDPKDPKKPEDPKK